ncbi:MAG: MBL fold metallo-hydrolase [Bacteroidota bacterium]
MKIKSSKGTKIHTLLAGMTNCYLINSNGINILIDSGTGKNYSRLKKNIKIVLDNHLTIDYHILTHTHYDHAGNSKSIKNDFSSKIIVHENEADWIKKGFTRLPKGTSWLFKLISNSGNKYAQSIGKYEPVNPDILVNSNLDLFPNIKIIHTPGHTIGSISIIIDDEIAFVGDTLIGIYKNKIFPPFADDVKNLYKSWELLLNTKCNLFLPGHGKPISRQKFENYFSI